MLWCRRCRVTPAAQGFWEGLGARCVCHLFSSHLPSPPTCQDHQISNCPRTSKKTPPCANFASGSQSSAQMHSAGSNTPLTSLLGSCRCSAGLVQDHQRQEYGATLADLFFFYNALLEPPHSPTMSPPPPSPSRLEVRCPCWHFPTTLLH